MNYNSLGRIYPKNQDSLYRSRPTLFENKPKHIHQVPLRYNEVTPYNAIDFLDLKIGVLAAFECIVVTTMSCRWA